MYQKKFTVDKQLENKYKSLFDYLDNDAWATEVEMERAQAINKLIDNVRFLSLCGVQFKRVYTGKDLLRENPQYANPKNAIRAFNREIKNTDIFLDVAFSPEKGSSVRCLKIVDLVGGAMGYNTKQAIMDRYFLIDQLTKTEMFDRMDVDRKSTNFFYNTTQAILYAKDYWRMSMHGSSMSINKYINDMFTFNPRDFAGNQIRNRKIIDFLRATYKVEHDGSMAWTETRMYETLLDIMADDIAFKSTTQPNTKYTESKLEAIESVRESIYLSQKSCVVSGIVNKDPDTVYTVNITEESSYEEVIEAAVCFAMEDVMTSPIMQELESPEFE